METSNHNIFPVYSHMINRQEKEQLLRQQSFAIWMTGLSGSGKTTIALLLEKELHKMNKLVKVLDGDNIRDGLNKNLGFSEADRLENIRRIAEVNKLFIDCGVITINCFVSPTVEIRALARDIIGKDDFLEVFIDTPLKICEQRDVKGLYKKARTGALKDFTGISSPFEPSSNAEIVVKTESLTPEQSVQHILNKIAARIEKAAE